MVTTARRAKVAHFCAACGGAIERGEHHWETEVVNRKPTVRVHRACGGSRAAHDAYQHAKALYAPMPAGAPN